MNTSRRITGAAIAAIALLTTPGTLLPAPPAAAAAPLACGTVITRDLRLTADLTDCAGSALVIGAAGVTIDLAGHTLSGTGKGAGIDNTAGHDRLRVIDGSIRGFLFGVEVFEADGVRLDRLALTGNADGLNVSRSSNLTATGLDASRNTSSGVSITFSDRSTIRSSTIAGNELFGIADRFGSRSRHAGNRIVGNAGTGLVIDRVEEATATRNTVGGNGNVGIELVSVEGALVSRNHAFGNASDGISADEPGSRLSHNLANGNAGFGIRAARGTRDGGGNAARGNLGGTCEGVRCR